MSIERNRKVTGGYSLPVRIGVADRYEPLTGAAYAVAMVAENAALPAATSNAFHPVEKAELSRQDRQVAVTVTVSESWPGAGRWVSVVRVTKGAAVELLVCGNDILELV